MSEIVDINIKRKMAPFRDGLAYDEVRSLLGNFFTCSDKWAKCLENKEPPPSAELILECVQSLTCICRSLKEVPSSSDSAYLLVQLSVLEAAEQDLLLQGSGVAQQVFARVLSMCEAQGEVPKLSSDEEDACKRLLSEETEYDDSEDCFRMRKAIASAVPYAESWDKSILLTTLKAAHGSIKKREAGAPEVTWKSCFSAIDKGFDLIPKILFDAATGKYS